MLTTFRTRHFKENDCKKQNKIKENGVSKKDNDIKVPTAKRIIVIKVQENCFFFTWNLEWLKNKLKLKSV